MVAALSKRPLISIVLPVYGTEAYIEKAISSIREQTYTDWELIVVDDCTPDRAADIAREAAAADPRIRVVSHETNQGLSGARNTGIAAAQGEWLWIPDSDDWYEADLLERAVGAAEAFEAGPDLVMFGLVEEYFDENGEHLYDHELPLSDALYATADEWHGLVLGWESSSHLGYAWNKFFRLSRVRELGLEYESVRLIEDVLFVADYLETAESVATISGTPYHYAKRRGRSLTGANAFSAREYWSLLVRRVERLKGLLEGWGVFDDAARATLGGLYCRFVVSALERTYFAGETFTGAERRAWLAEMRASELFQELVPAAASGGSKVVGLAIKALQSGSDTAILAVARTTYFAHARAYSLFTRLRSRR